MHILDVKGHPHLRMAKKIRPHHNLPVAPKSSLPRFSKIDMQSPDTRVSVGYFSVTLGDMPHNESYAGTVHAGSNAQSTLVHFK